MDQKQVYFTRQRDTRIHITDFMPHINRQIILNGKFLVSYQIEDRKAH